MIPAVIGLILAAFVIAAIVILAVAAKSGHAPNHGLALVVDGPTPDEPDVELVDELPLRAQAIEVPREGVVQQPPGHYDCFDNYVDRQPSLVCAVCLPILRARAGTRT